MMKKIMVVLIVVFFAGSSLLMMTSCAKKAVKPGEGVGAPAAPEILSREVLVDSIDRHHGAGDHQSPHRAHHMTGLVGSQEGNQ